MKKHTYEYVKNYFEEQGCELLEKKYKNSKTKMKYKCSCGNESKICFNNFKYKHRCMKCGTKKASIKQSFTFKYVYNYFKEQKCKLLEKEYINNWTRMKYRCECGNISYIRFSDFKSEQRCLKCSGTEKYSYDYIYNYFKEHKCELLEKKYINNHTKMKYKCSCGNKSKIRFNSFKKGERCKMCFNSGFSKESQKLFDCVYEKLGENYREKIYYATLNKEFGIKKEQFCFKYDFVNSKFKKVIEYNGSVFHPIPSLKNSDVGWFPFDKSKTAGEAREYEKIKYKAIENCGFQILTIWDYEMKKDFDDTVNRCLGFLMS
jgi:hypothetical protein